MAHDDFDDKTRPGSFFGGGEQTAVEPAPGAPQPPASQGGLADAVDERSSIFRREALEAHARPRNEGELLKLSPAWTSWTFYLLVALFVVGAVYSVVGTVHEWAEGPAIVRVVGKTPLSAKNPGTVASVEVQPGQRVSSGDLLARFYSSEELSRLEQIKKDYGDQLRKVLRDPNDQAARSQLITLNNQREKTERDVNERAVYAPHAGVIADVRIRPGQHLMPGDPLFGLVGDAASYQIVAFLPGHFRPLLRVGMPLRLEMSGFKYAYREVVIDKIGDEIIGPTEVRRFLGQDVADAVPVGGPVVLIEAHLRSREFTVEGEKHEYYDGLQGSAEVKVRTDSLLFTFVPGLKAVTGGR